MNRRQFITHFSASALALSMPGLAMSAPAAGSSATAIVKAGQQRVLSQRSTKAWLMQALGIMPEKAGRWLAESITQFDRQLEELEGLGSTSALGLLVRLDADWRSLKEALAAAPSQATAEDVFTRSDAVLTSADMAVRAFEKLSGTRVGWLINTSGRQSMLSQRAADFVYFNAFGINSGEAREGLERVRADFAEGLAELKEAPENTDKITRELALAEQQWFLFEGALSDASSPRALKDIATTSELMLRQLNVLDELYADLPIREDVMMKDA
ncbi:type IV pili methyl-accepting chemotaxis transducer N-terminal domain-containing protein [Nitrogeniibacter aestuarii]|uniref:type IV pili methyl-accepting chemotaxis transducer N-terminal domain-containing protein n=1 Tax=Nitrogeniibacter aestuarii TaxID=2815343 RepID=UPI001D0FE72B|nr:type IV pili methyl-accepting chemotaxis transducer N-terminal domain-containing protein [Nitrogeniibacter aestuarii]